MELWNYLEALLATKVNEETAERIIFAHQKLPILFKQMQTESKIICIRLNMTVFLENFYTQNWKTTEKKYCVRKWQSKSKRFCNPSPRTPTKNIY